MNRLKQLRKEKNLTLDDIQKETSINRGTYNNYENGTTKPSDDTWQALADFFGVSVDWLKGYGYSREELAKLLSDGYDESFTYQHSRDLDNEIMSAIAKKTGNKVMQSLVVFQKEYGNLKKLVDYYAKAMNLKIPKNKSDRVKFFNSNFDLLFNMPETQRLLHATHSYTDTEVKETLLDALLNAMGGVYIAYKFDKDKPNDKHQ
ncbi:helix-turn-helix domain-containing protein [Lactobacillus paragasseri]|uniref:Helix-turn-helix transcriptional regulator n=1 Tax=Lactobacillus paragasseri TaxID=2107999 RepID=A0ABD5A2Y3_9LACO|nr:helix-turn-helix transcriptional regulator [Lactobacillus paragasseri]MDK7953354.1 helix-turn-helix transcriptional regulator [Lactobacillus paragasseri]MDO6362213.1 helix-turn-helix transcriptional regulator [Lactobacillus paragasseri]MDX5060548.1 helix-turn-helix transcriptional regulator [Lactobacillus paragasseri]